MEEKNSGLSSVIVNKFSMEKAKIVAFVLAVGFIINNSFNYLDSDDTCRRLLSSGEYRANGEWQPSGCMMHKYGQKDANICMQSIHYWGGRNSVVFAGDSRIRQLYFRFVNLLSAEPTQEYKAHSDLHYRDEKSGTKIDFVWLPAVNGSLVEFFSAIIEKPQNERPKLVVTGGATWNIKYIGATPKVLQWYQENVTKLVPYFEKLKDSTKILWKLQDPVEEERLNASRKMITDALVNEYNEAAIKALYSSAALLWSSSRLVAKHSSRRTLDGLHVSKSTLDIDVSILFNLHCNNEMHHVDGTCCRDAEKVTFLQLVVATVLTLLLFLWILSLIWRRPQKQIVTSSGGVEAASPGAQGADAAWDNFYTVIRALGRFAVIMAYFYLCDRTNLFLKENKHYTLWSFLLPLGIFLALGLLFTKDSDQTAVLHRDQTDEWKGWMQIVILTYHYTGASKVIPIYMQIRCLVSAYLFLTGFGHFTFFYKKGDFSAFRFSQVMFRMNFLVLMLCLVMNRPYQFYYFVPLVSFFFLGVYVVLALWPRVTAAAVDGNRLYYVLLLLKFGLLFLGTFLLNSSFVFFERIFLLPGLKPIFSLDHSVSEWYFRWSIDRFSTIDGMIFAFALLMLKKHKLISEADGQLLFSRHASSVAGVGALLAFSGYTFYTCTCTSKPSCNSVHAYVSFVPLVSFIIVRNLPGWLRKRYSTLFAWIGKISLELFIGQYHTWLAADTKGLLVLVPNNPLLNLLVSSFIFVCIAHEIHHITATLANFAVPKETKYLARNCGLFALVLAPVAISKGAMSDLW